MGNSVYWYDSCGAQGNLIQTCSYNQTCSNGSCTNQQNISVQTNSATNNFNNQATLNGYVYGVNSGATTYVWFQWGISSSYGYETLHQTQSYSGSFNQNIANLSSNTTYHFRAVAQNIYGNIVYGSDMTFTAGSTNQTGSLVTVNKKVRNLSSGNLNWSSSASASPSDVLMFMITITTTGNQNINNMTVRDVFSANLIYKNQLAISSANYTDDINSIISIGTILANQTVIITYQAQVASPQYFNYGTTTLNNSVSVNSSESSAKSSVSVVVTKTAVLGATSISTGLTNNFLADSFFLPLLIALIGVWMFKSNIFCFEKWIDVRKTNHQEYRTQKELAVRINQIKQIERN